MRQGPWKTQALLQNGAAAVLGTATGLVQVVGSRGRGAAVGEGSEVAGAGAVGAVDDCCVLGRHLCLALESLFLDRGLSNHHAGRRSVLPYYLHSWSGKPSLRGAAAEEDPCRSSKDGVACDTCRRHPHHS